MKKYKIIILLTVVLLGCHRKEYVKNEQSMQQADISIKQQNERSQTISESDAKIEEANETKIAIENTNGSEVDFSMLPVSENKIHDGSYNMTNEIIYEYGRLLSGSWTAYPDRIDGERKLSWGTVPYANKSYTLIDFVAVQPIYIMGHTEGGPIGYDSRVAEVVKIERIKPSVFRIYYFDDTSGVGPMQGNFVFHFNKENDTISLVERNGTKFNSPVVQHRVSERLPEFEVDADTLQN